MSRRYTRETGYRFALLSLGLAALTAAGGVRASENGAQQPAPVQVWTTDTAQALAQAQERNRPVYVYVWAKYHLDCVRMAQLSLPHEDVNAQLASFELLALDAHDPANFDFFDRYEVSHLKVTLPSGEGGQPDELLGASIWPAHLFLDPQGRELHRLYGFLPGPAFAEKLGHVLQLLDHGRALEQDPDSAVAEAGLGHALTMLEALDRARPPLERALVLDPRDQTGVRAGVRLDLAIIGLPDDPPAAQQTLRQWRSDYPGHARTLEAIYFEAVAEVAADRPHQAERLLSSTFEQAQPDSPEQQSRWYAPAMLLLHVLRSPQLDLD